MSRDPLDSRKVAPAVETSSGRLGTVTRSTWSGKATGKTLAKEMARAAEKTELTAPTTKKVCTSITAVGRTSQEKLGHGSVNDMFRVAPLFFSTLAKSYLHFSFNFFLPMDYLFDPRSEFEIFRRKGCWASLAKIFKQNTKYDK